MDHTQILHTLQNAIPTAIWYLIPFFLVAAVIKAPWFKGRAGETVVNLSARLFRDKARHLPVIKITLQTEDDTNQTHPIIVFLYGGYCRTKNYRGPNLCQRKKARMETKSTQIIKKIVGTLEATKIFFKIFKCL
jgi:hypothetical protein